jgi:hypothetical protein
VTGRLKARIVEQEEAVIARQRHSKHISAAKIATHNNIGTVGSGDFYVVRADAI